MNRDPSTFNKNTKIMAKLLAEIINDFFEPLTYKTITLVAILIGIMIFISECVFGNRRSNNNNKTVKNVD